MQIKNAQKHAIKKSKHTKIYTKSIHIRNIQHKKQTIQKTKTYKSNIQNYTNTYTIQKNINKTHQKYKKQKQKKQSSHKIPQNKKQKTKKYQTQKTQKTYIHTYT